MVRRSVLFAPGDKPELMRKAAESDADVVVFDLEDAVAPADKRAAREAVREVLDGVESECEVCVRVNPIGISAAADLEAVLAGPRPDSVMLPKTEGAEDVRTIDRLLEEHGADLPVLSLIESAPGVLRADDIAAADATDALLFGAEDLAADIGATRTSEGTEVLYARERTVIAASAAGVDAIDIVYTDYTDADGLREETTFAAGLGYDGKMAIHPDQVPVINDAFTPADEDVEWAERVLDARDRTDAGVFEVDGEMIDAPLIAQAERIVERARQAE
ncbi:CoA ester lyase [Natrinema sp. 1APR25-10V2]|uniref:HpcH/HpaI aldolase/citrate lyase family protein n=1 Tax=Natrinema sp. 1APR25-10V2 TaxID=2951081 RepID=UPI0028762FE9|nr:CoA ester lyase [Natrinema sp. 1APR25-10V2]MDS0477747.1 CoA ester lyase [Natrinema sp. 1APR25-10V2]